MLHYKLLQATFTSYFSKAFKSTYFMMQIPIGQHPGNSRDKQTKCKECKRGWGKVWV